VHTGDTHNLGQRVVVKVDLGHRHHTLLMLVMYAFRVHRQH
jgi:hypothetical protein